MSSTSATPSTHSSHGSDHGHGPGPDAWPRDGFAGKASALKLGMWVFLVSDALTFGGLLLTYAVIRGGADRWVNPGEPQFGINFTAVLTFLLICSSLTMVMGVAAAKENKRKQTMFYLALTILGGLLFLTGQFQEYWGIVHPGLLKSGLAFGQSHRATTFYAITGFHGFHVASGVVYLTVMLLRTAGNKTQPVRSDGIEAAGLFWHFVDLVWILVFTFIYLIPEPAVLP